MGNLAAGTTSDELKCAFSLYGDVKYVVILHDGNPDRFEAGLYGYIEMNIKAEGISAINDLNGTILKGRVISAIEARPLSAKKIESPAWRWRNGTAKVRE